MKHPSEVREAVPARQVEPYSLTIEGVTAHFGISRSGIYRLIGDGKLTARKIGGRTMLLTADVRAMIQGAPTAPIRTKPAA